MPTSLLEIVDLGDGEIVLQRAEEGADSGDETGEGGAGSNREPLVTIRFSEESRLYIMDQGLEVAKAMIQAGLQAASELSDQAEIEIEEESSSSRATPRTLH